MALTNEPVAHVSTFQSGAAGRNVGPAVSWPSLLRMMRTSAMEPYKVRDFYTLLSSETFFTERTKFFNLGYWRDGPRSLDDACTALAELLGRRAGLQAGDAVLDAGCGFGDAAQYWLHAHGLGRIVGINITPAQLGVAATRARGGPRVDAPTFVLGSATQLPFPSATFDKVVALESAFHFVTRERFFREAWRVLRPGGVLATADMLPLPRLRWRRAWARGFRGVKRLWHDHGITVYPYLNAYDRHEYARRLRAVHFQDIEVDSIREDVYGPALKWFAGWLRTSARPDVLPMARRVAAATLGEGVLHGYLANRFDYVIAVARKPRARL